MLLATGSTIGLTLLIPSQSLAAVPGASWKDGLAELESGFGGRIGAYAFDRSTRTVLSYRGDEQFPLLSTFKVLAGAAVLHKARRCRGDLLGREVRWTEADLVDYSPITEQHIDIGMTVAELCLAAIAHSDNTAANLILDQIGGPAQLTAFVRTLGDEVTRLDRWETDLNDWRPGEVRDTTSPAAMGRDLRKLLLGRSLSTDDRSTLIGWMEASTTGGARIRAGVPGDWIVGDKTGSASTYGCAHDVAVAHPPAGEPVVLAVYTNRTVADLTWDDAVVAATATILVEALGH